MSMTGSWLWAAEVPGVGYYECQAHSYREAVEWIRALHGQPPTSLRIVGYRAYPERDAEPKPLRMPVSEIKTRNMGHAALRLYMILSADFPALSILCGQEARYRHSIARMRDFLANMGAAIQHLPGKQRDVVAQRTKTVLEGWRYAAAEINARRAGDFEHATEYGECKDGCQEISDRLRRRQAHREAMKTLNMALDGCLPESQRVIENWIDALVAVGMPDHEARALASQSRRIGIPRL